MAPKSPKSQVAVAALALPQAIIDQVDALPFTIPAYRASTPGEVGGLGIEALEGYAYGERVRFDSQGRRWDFVREVFGNEFRLSVRCSIGGIELCSASMPLDRVASKEGEEALLGLVERMVGEADAMAAACRAHQQGLKTETDALPPVEAHAEPALIDDPGGSGGPAGT
jgi:hypothetical protein